MEIVKVDAATEIGAGSCLVQLRGYLSRGVAQQDRVTGSTRRGRRALRAPPRRCVERRQRCTRRYRSRSFAAAARRRNIRLPAPICHTIVRFSPSAPLSAAVAAEVIRPGRGLSNQALLYPLAVASCRIERITVLRFRLLIWHIYPLLIMAERPVGLRGPGYYDRLPDLWRDTPDRIIADAAIPFQV